MLFTDLKKRSDTSLTSSLFVPPTHSFIEFFFFSIFLTGLRNTTTIVIIGFVNLQVQSRPGTTVLTKHTKSYPRFLPDY